MEVIREDGPVTDQPAVPLAPLAPARRPRGRQTVGDMVRSLAAVMVLVGVVVAFNVVDQPEPVVRDIDYADALAEARDTLPYDVLAPGRLPDGWRATSARTRLGEGATWHLGLVTAAGNYAAVEESDGSRRAFVARFAGGSRPAGETTIDGDPWRRLRGGDPDPRALVRTAGGVTTVVTGTGRWRELEQLAGSLRPRG